MTPAMRSACERLACPGCPTSPSSAGMSVAHLACWASVLRSDVLSIDVHGVQQSLQLVVLHPAVCWRVPTFQFDSVGLQSTNAFLGSVALVILPALGDDAA